jgi:flagellar hook-length control protein FliK
VQNQAVQAQAVKGGAATQAATGVQGSATPAAANGGGESQAQTAVPQAATQAQQTAQTQQAQKPAQAPQAQQHRATVDQVNVQITKALKAGADKINIQLKPASLGRVDVQLELSDGRVTATIMADSKDTLDMLKNGARDLTRALNNAGLQADSQDLNFNLRENHQQQARSGAQGQGERLDFADGGDEPEAGADTLNTAAGPRNIVEDGRVDIHA